MAITLAAAALGSIVKLNVGGEPREFYVHRHGTERTILVQKYVEGLVRIGEYDKPYGYIDGEADKYLNVTYANQLDPEVLAVAASEIVYSTNGTGETGTAERVCFMLSVDEYLTGGAPAAATKGDGTPQAYWSSSMYPAAVSGRVYWHIKSDGSKSTQYANDYDCVRPCLNLPNNTIVNDDGSLTVVSLDATALLPCIKY